MNFLCPIGIMEYWNIVLKMLFQWLIEISSLQCLPKFNFIVPFFMPSDLTG